MASSNKVDRRLAVLDVEGIIIPKRRYLLLQATKKPGFTKTLILVFLGFLYEINFFTLEKTLQEIYRLFEGVSKEEFHQTFKAIPVIPGVQQVFQRLREKGYQIAIISSGLPDFFAEELAKQLGANYASGLRLEMVNNRITGKISGDVIKPNGKAIVLERILKEENYSRHQCIVVADDRNNLPMFPLVAKTIGYNPDAMVAAKCDYAVKGNLQDILPFLDTSVKTSRTPYTRNDAFREVIHMGSFLIPLLCQFLDVNRYAMAGVIFATTIAYAFSELARREGANFPPFTVVTNVAAVGEEKWGFATSPILFALGIILSLILYPAQTGFAVIAILTLGDGAARITGKMLGKKVLPYNKTKKLEGTAVGILASASASLLFVTPFKALVASTISMIVESLPSPINDNIMIPIVAGVVLTAIP